MLWIALSLPELSLQLAERNLDRAIALVIAAGPSNRPTVFAANRVALDAGIHPGLTLAAARALVNELLALPRQIPAEQEAIRNLAAWAGQFTPAVTLQDHQGLLLEVSSVLTLHKGLQRLLRKLDDGFAKLGYQASRGVAPTPIAAWLLARVGQGDICTDLSSLEARLRDLPLALLDWSPESLATLADLGIVRIGQFLALPSDGARKRFGAQCALDLQRALGGVPDPRLFFVPPESYRGRSEFGFEVNDALALLFPLKRFLAELEGFLRARGAGIFECRLILEHSDHSDTRIRISVGQPQRDARRLLVLARERLTRVVLPAPVTGMVLEAPHLVPFIESNTSWLPDGREPAEGWQSLIDKLTARLGRDQVYRLQARDDFRPEEAWQTITPTAPWKARTPPELGLARPLLLLPVPRKLTVEEGVPLHHGPVTRIAGPERIEFGWWDGRPASRDYYVGRNTYGETLWLFRDLNDPGSWHLHGYFA
jgi:protein ImuB